MSSLRVIITPLAQSDIEAIGDHIALENPVRAMSFARELLERCLSLSVNPHRFPLAERLPHAGVRKVAHGNYIIFYLVYEDRISIARVLHGASDYAAKFLNA